MNLENPQILLLLVPILFIIGLIFKKDIEKFEKPSENIENSVNHTKFSTEFSIWIILKKITNRIIHNQTPHKSALNIDVNKGYSKPSIDKNKTKKITLFAIRSVIIILLMIAIAQPFVLKEKISETKKTAIFLSDISASFQLFQNEETDLLIDKISQQKFKKIEFGNDKKTDLAEGISKIAKDTTLIILSDGNNNLGNLKDVVNNAVKDNITIITVKPTQTKKDVSVSIEGPQKTFENIETEYIIKLKGKEKEEVKKINLYLDGVKEEENINVEKIVKEKLSKGKHELVVEIEYRDHFKENNKDIKEIIVEQRPRILFISDKGSDWINALKVYDLVKQKEIPLEINEYDSIIFNDVKEFSETEAKRIREYLLNGGGIVFIGGKNSLEYGNYENELIEDLLPSKVGLTNKKESEYNIVVLIDISSSTGLEQEGTKKVEIEKAQAINIISKLKPKNKIGAIAFNTQSFKIAEIDLVERNRDSIVANISSLQSGGGTVISEGLNSAINELKQTTGNKLIILISDGKTQDYEKTIDSAKEAEKEGIKIFTIGTGNDDLEKLKEIAEIAGGEYLLADKTKTASILYNKFSDDVNLDLTIANNEHFITKNTTMSGRATGANNVIAKNSATVLVKAGENDLITVWNFGNGRSALIATGEEFAKELFDRNREIIKRTISWASAQIKDKEELMKKSTELKENELNEEFFKMVKENGGEVFSPKEFMQNELEKIKTETRKELIKEQKYYTSLFIELAILLFLLEIGLRKFVFDVF